MVKAMQDTYIDANPAYEEMEGVVAGVRRSSTSSSASSAATCRRPSSTLS